MRRKIGFLLVVIGLIAAVTFAVRALSSRGPKQGELKVDSVPTALVFLDNKNIGRTPYKDKVDVGSFTIKLVPESPTAQLTSWQGKIDIGHKLLTYVNAALSESELSTAVDVVWLEKITSKKSELSVTTSPDGATVLVDDVTKGLTPLIIQDIAPGDHSVTVTSRGFLTRNLKIKTTPGYKVLANLKLALDPSGTTEGVVPIESPDSMTTGTGTPTPKASPTKAATSSAGTATPVKPYVVIKETPTGFLRVRMEPSTSATEAARVNPGEKYSILSEENGWYEIKYDGVNTGWVSGQYAEKIE